MTMKLDTTNNRLTLSGKLIKLTHAPLSYVDGNGKERRSNDLYYQITVAVNNEDVTNDTLASIRKAYYTNTEDGFIPRWLKTDVETVDFDGKQLLVNLRSRYDLKHFVRCDDDYECISFDTLEYTYGVVVGSDVSVSCNCKDGAIYPAAIRYDRLKTVSVDDYF